MELGGTGSPPALGASISERLICRRRTLYITFRSSACKTGCARRHVASVSLRRRK